MLTSPSRSSVATTERILSTKCFSQTRSALHCSWCLKPSRPPSGWRSCCMTCSICHSTRSLPLWRARRVQGKATVPDADRTQQRAAVDAFLAAARDGDFDALLAVLDPDVVLRADRGAIPPGASCPPDVGV
jgi:hypothetical protein